MTTAAAVAQTVGPSGFARRAAIVGVGQTAYLRRSDRDEWDLALEAVRNAADDAGIRPSEIDGIVRYSQDRIHEAQLAGALGLSLRYHGQVGFGGQSVCAVVGQAAAAIHAGLARVVVCYRALNGRTGARYGRAERSLEDEGNGTYRAFGDRVPSGAFSAPYGLLAPGQVMALWARRYAHEAGIGIDVLSAALARIAIDQRAWASRNPAAVMGGRPLDLAAYQAGRVLAEPLRLHDFCLETDGAAAIVVCDAERARAISRQPVYVVGATQALYAEAMEVYGELINGPDHRARARALFAGCGGMTAADVDVAMLYDATTIMVLLQLEGYGFVPPGRAWETVIERGIGAEGVVPVNTSGGQLSEAYVHGMNLVIEAVRQLRGTASSPVPGAATALVGAAGASSLVLAR
ncbi:MAG: lipid-transfer protein [Myxococcota bacterium]